MSCGLTATTTTPAPATAAALSLVASTPWRSRSSASHSSRRAVTTTSDGSRQPELSRPERRASPIRPPPRIAILRSLMARVYEPGDARRRSPDRGAAARRLRRRQPRGLREQERGDSSVVAGLPRSGEDSRRLHAVRQVRRRPVHEPERLHDDGRLPRPARHDRASVQGFSGLSSHRHGWRSVDNPRIYAFTKGRAFVAVDTAFLTGAQRRLGEQVYDVQVDYRGADRG